MNYLDFITILCGFQELKKVLDKQPLFLVFCQFVRYNWGEQNLLMGYMYEYKTDYSRDHSFCGRRHNASNQLLGEPMVF